ncbi:CE1 family esterase [Nocardia callitridis]|uniref:PHB depolymerase family esterase n=1 Tax=Nocardia callitridis TaxID=648753 RepID=A0ABP9K0R3_9NOCA
MLKIENFTSRLRADAELVTRRREHLARVAGVAALAVSLTALTGVAHAEEPDPAPTSSAGCGEPTPAAGNTTVPFTAAGKSGSYILDVPIGADHPLPVVLDLHGYLEPAAIEHSVAALGEFGAAHGFLTVTPEINEPGLPRWDFAQGAADVEYLEQLLTHVESTLCVDQARVFVTGLSMGAFTTSSLACQFSDRIAAIAPVAGLQDFPWCQTTRPVPVVAFHGTDDPIIAYTGGTGPNARLLPSPDGTGSAVEQQNDGPAVNGPGPQSIPDNAAAWARRNGCDPTPREQQIAPDVTRTDYACAEDATVALYTVHGGGHTWPGSTSVIMPPPLVGNTTRSISANEVMWDFFQAHPLRN